MNIEISRSALLPALGAVSGVVERRQTLPILGNLLVSASDSRIAIVATDLELEIGTRLEAEITEEGEATVPARKFVDICRALPENAQVRLRTEGDRALVSSGRSRFTLSTLPAGNFPSMEVEDSDCKLSFPASLLKTMFEKTAFAMAQQDVRYYLNGVMLELEAGRVTTVATDGHRLAKVVADMDTGLDDAGQPRQVIIPAKAVIEVKRLLPAQDDPVTVELSERTFRVSFADTVIVSKLVDGRYPEYQRVIPVGLPRRALMDKDSLRSALQRAAILSNEKYKGVRVSFDSGTLGLQAHNPEKEQADDEIEMDYDGDPVVIGFNVAYIMDVIQAVEQERVEVVFRDADSSAIWHGEGTDTETFVIMPMRL
ncbi:MAG: DNA polymerase III subunit beta [Thiohalocapsa sp.]